MTKEHAIWINSDILLGLAFNGGELTANQNSLPHKYETRNTWLVSVKKKQHKNNFNNMNVLMGSTPGVFVFLRPAVKSRFHTSR